MLALVDLLLSMPASSAICEQGFSEMKRVKTDWRSRMRNDTLIDLMRVKIESPSIEEYDPTPAVASWMVPRWMVQSKRTRRPGVSKNRPRKRQMPDSDDSEDWSLFELDSESDSEEMST